MKLWVWMKFHNLLFEWPNWTMSINIPWIGVQSWALGQAALSHTMEGWGGKRGMPPSPLHNTWQCKPAMLQSFSDHRLHFQWIVQILLIELESAPHIEEVLSLIFTLSLSSPLLPASLMIVIKERVSVARNDLSHNQINSRHRIGLTKNNWSSQQMDVASMQRTLSRTMERWGECVELFITTHVHHQPLSPPQYMTVSHCRPQVDERRCRKCRPVRGHQIRKYKNVDAILVRTSPYVITAMIVGIVILLDE